MWNFFTMRYLFDIHIILWALANDSHLSNDVKKSNKHIKELKNIKNKKTKHNDPFDKTLLAQAIFEKLIFIIHDKKFDVYSNQNIMLV